MKTGIKKGQSGHVVLMALILLATMSLLLGTLLAATASQIVAHRAAVSKQQALHIAEAGLEMAIWKLNNQGGYDGETDTEFGSGAYTIAVSSIDSNKKAVTVTGNVPNNAKALARKTITIITSIDSSTISFRYGLQAGSGGLAMGGGATINGNVYSNGNIGATTGAVITGSAVAANPPALTADQVNDAPTPIVSCSASACITFANASATEDFAQSFRLSNALPLNNIQFYIKKTGSPSNATVKIVTDNNGSPSTTVLLSGTLSASFVTATFGWVSVTLPTTPVLDPSQIYWMVIDAASNASRYYTIGANAGGYANGEGKIGRQGGMWNATTPFGLDGYFKVYLGGGTSTIGGSNNANGAYIGTTVSDETWAHTVMGATVSGPLYCQASSFTNKPCDTTRPDPAAQPLPLSDGNIQEWKDEAEAGGTITGNYTVGSAGASLGPKKITGNLLVNGGGILTVTGTLWVEGTITVTGGGEVKLAPVYGESSGAIVSDGYISLNGGAEFSGSGISGSYLFLVTTSACPAAAGCGGNNAISLSGGAGTVALIAQNGTADINGGASLKQVTAKQITMGGGAELTYDSGLISENFYSGPGGSWKFVPGSYIIQ